MRKILPRILLAEPLGGARIRLFFSNGRILETTISHVRSVARAKIVHGGHGLDPGNGQDRSAAQLHDGPGKLWRKGVG